MEWTGPEISRRQAKADPERKLKQFLAAANEAARNGGMLILTAAIWDPASGLPSGL